MSVQYQKQIFNSDKLRLYVNFSGITPDDATNANDLELVIYALDNNYQHLFTEVLNFNQALDFFNHLNSFSIIRNSAATHTGRFIEISDNKAAMLSLIDKVDRNLVKLILDKAAEGEKLKFILDSLSEVELQNLHAATRQASHIKAIKDLRQLLELEATTEITQSIIKIENLAEYVAGQPEKIFQNWIERNIWTLGIDYIKKHSARQIGISSESDLIMETTDGFIDLIELKRPKFPLFSYDDSHKSYYPSKELSKVIGQCMLYLKTLDDYKLILEKEHKFKLLRPRVKIIVGRSQDFNEKEFEALRMLNSVLNHIQVISYDYLCMCGDNIISYYNNQLEETIKNKDEVLLGSIS